MESGDGVCTGMALRGAALGDRPLSCGAVIFFWGHSCRKFDTMRRFPSNSVNGLLTTCFLGNHILNFWKKYTKGERVNGRKTLAIFLDMKQY
jgi:hypothetical protein